jgi:adenylosuccinate synthase
MIKIVIGTGFGDEGKGLATDYLCAQNPQNVEKTLVIRFNGGHQAGHTVVMADGKRHVFSCFGAGTLRGCPSYWSRFCTFSPASVRNEYNALNSLNINPLLYVDGLCAVTTHYDMAWNRLSEFQRGGDKHGSCGVGFGATIERHFHSPVKLFVEDLWVEKIFLTKLATIRDYYKNRINKETSFNFDDLPHIEEDARFLDAVAAVRTLRKKKVIQNVCEAEMFENKSFKNYVFEGAQGILLDMDFGFFPYVTRSHTTSQNALSLIHKYLDISKTEIYYMSRVYQTRHGAGPMTGTHHEFVLKNNEKETNVFNDYQENFRVAPLDIDYLKYALQVDNHFSTGVKKKLFLTCLDQLEETAIPCTIGNVLKTFSIMEIVQQLGFKKTDCLFSRGATAGTVTRF